MLIPKLIGLNSRDSKASAGLRFSTKTAARFLFTETAARFRVGVATAFAVVSLLGLFCHTTVGQKAPDNAKIVQIAQPVATPAEDARYRIGPGDVLAILVRKAPELSLEAVRVDQRGMIRIPMIEGEIQAACRTENELGSQIATLYLEYKKAPNVDVFVREFQSRPVAVIGAVNAPGQFRLQRQVRLLELLSFAGGPSVAAGRTINVIHTGGPNVCGEPEAAAGTGISERMAIYRLNETLAGSAISNPFVMPGDMVSIPEADQVFVVGDVVSPRPISLKDKPITVSRAVAMAGGPQRDSKTSRIRIIRQTADGTGRQEIFVDLKAIEKQKSEDVMLMPNDIVNVPSSAGKSLLQALQGAIAPAISQGTIRAIP